MKKEFLLFIRHTPVSEAGLTEEAVLLFRKKQEIYEGKLSAKGKLLEVRTLLKEGFLVTREAGKWSTKKSTLGKGHIAEVYYHIRVKDLDEAIKLARENPVFEFIETAVIEIRQLDHNS
jgi:hypothetical protein